MTVASLAKRRRRARERGEVTRLRRINGELKAELEDERLLGAARRRRECEILCQDYRAAALEARAEAGILRRVLLDLWQNEFSDRSDRWTLEPIDGQPYAYIWRCRYCHFIASPPLFRTVWKAPCPHDEWSTEDRDPVTGEWLTAQNTIRLPQLRADVANALRRRDP